MSQQSLTLVDHLVLSLGSPVTQPFQMDPCRSMSQRGESRGETHSIPKLGDRRGPYEVHAKFRTKACLLA